MTTFYLLIGGVVLIALCLLVINNLTKKEAQHREEIETLRDALRTAEDRINVQTELLNKMETGSASGDLAACNDILHELSKK